MTFSISGEDFTSSGGNRFAGLHFAREQAHDFELAFVRRDTECERRAFVIGKRKTDQSKTGGITFDLVE